MGNHLTSGGRKRRLFTKQVESLERAVTSELFGGSEPSSSPFRDSENEKDKKRETDRERNVKLEAEQDEKAAEGEKEEAEDEEDAASESISSSRFSSSGCVADQLDAFLALEQTTRFSRSELRILYAHFTSRVPDITAITIAEMKRLWPMFPDLVLENLFPTTRHQAHFEQVMMNLSIMDRGTAEEKAELAFRFFSRGNDFIRRKKLNTLIESMKEIKPIPDGWISEQDQPYQLASVVFPPPIPEDFMEVFFEENKLERSEEGADESSSSSSSSSSDDEEEKEKNEGKRTGSARDLLSIGIGKRKSEEQLEVDTEEVKLKMKKKKGKSSMVTFEEFKRKMEIFPGLRNVFGIFDFLRSTVLRPIKLVQDAIYENQGFLYKKGINPLKRWKERWASIRGGCMFLYYLKEAADLGEPAYKTLVLDDCLVKVLDMEKYVFKLRVHSYECTLRAESFSEMQLWVAILLQYTYESTGNPYNSFAPQRDGINVRWHTCGRDSFEAIADAIDAAKSEILIATPIISPLLYLKRPPRLNEEEEERGSKEKEEDYKQKGKEREEVLQAGEGGGELCADEEESGGVAKSTATQQQQPAAAEEIDYSRYRLDTLLKRKASEGVRIYILLPRGLKAMGSLEAGNHLLGLHENIYVVCAKTARVAPQHQTIVVADQDWAFVGGLELTLGRWDDPSFSLADECHLQMTWPGKDYANPRISAPHFLNPFSESIDRNRYPRMPWHSVMVSVDGLAAGDVSTNYIQRWNHNRVFNCLNNNKTTPIPFLCTKRRVEDTFVFRSGGTGGEHETDAIPKKEKSWRWFHYHYCHPEPHHHHFSLSIHPHLHHHNKEDDDGEERASDSGDTHYNNNNNNNHTNNGEERRHQHRHAATHVASATITTASETLHGLRSHLRRGSSPLSGREANNGGFGDTDEDDGDYDEEEEEDGYGGEELEEEKRRRWRRLLKEGVVGSSMAASEGWERRNSYAPTASMFLQQQQQQQQQREEEQQQPKGVTCQVVRTISARTGASQTDHSIYEAILHAIETSEHYVYIENQSFISSLGDPAIRNNVGDVIIYRIRKALLANKKFRIILLLPVHGLPIFSARNRRTMTLMQYRGIYRGAFCLRDRILSEFPGSGGVSQHICICSLRNYGYVAGKLRYEQIQITSSVVIVDDRIAIVGSAEITDASLLGPGCEIAVIVSGGETRPSMMNGEPYEVSKVVQCLRIQLWRMHLGLEPNQEESIMDAVADQVFEDIWLRTASTNSVVFRQVFPRLAEDDDLPLKQRYALLMTSENPIVILKLQSSARRDSTQQQHHQTIHVINSRAREKQMGKEYEVKEVKKIKKRRRRRKKDKGHHEDDDEETQGKSEDDNSTTTSGMTEDTYSDNTMERSVDYASSDEEGCSSVAGEDEEDVDEEPRTDALLDGDESEIGRERERERWRRKKEKEALLATVKGHLTFYPLPIL